MRLLQWIMTAEPGELLLGILGSLILLAFVIRWCYDILMDK